MKNSSERVIHGFVQVGWYRPTSVFAASIVYLKNKPPSGQKLLMSIHVYHFQQRDEGSKRVLCLPMAQEARATPYILYKRAYTYSRYDVL